MSVNQKEENVRPWGRYDILFEGPTFKVKNIIVSAGARLSLQRHQKRAEHWFFVSGDGIATVGQDQIKVTTNSTIDIPIGEIHRIQNIGTTDLIFVEIQTGTYFGEDDIERLEDDFGRK